MSERHDRADSPPPDGPARAHPVLRRALRALAACALVALCVAALLLLGLRYVVLPRIDAFRPRIQTLVSERLHVQFRIVRLAPRWNGLQPGVEVTGLTIRDRHGALALNVPRASVDVAWRSLFRLEPIVSATIEQPDLRVERDANGALYVAGVAVPGTHTGNAAFSTWLLNQPAIVLRGGTLRWHDATRDAPDLALRDLRMALLNDGVDHRFALQAPADGALLHGPLDFRAHFSHPRFSTAGKPENWRGDAYLASGPLDLPTLARYLTLPLTPYAGRIDNTLWASFSAGRITSAHGVLDGASLALRVRATQPRLDVPGAHFAWRVGAQPPGDYTLKLTDFRATLRQPSSGGGTPGSGAPGGVSPTRTLAFAWLDARFRQPSAGQGQLFSVRGDLIDLGLLAQFMRALPLPGRALDALVRFDPRGSVAHYDFMFERAAPGTARDPTNRADGARGGIVTTDTRAVTPAGSGRDVAPGASPGGADGAGSKGVADDGSLRGASGVEPKGAGSARSKNAANDSPQSASSVEPKGVDSAKSKNAANDSPQSASSIDPKGVDSARPKSAADTRPQGAADADLETTSSANPKGTVASARSKNITRVGPKSASGIGVDAKATSSANPKSAANASSENATNDSPQSASSVDETTTASVKPAWEPIVRYRLKADLRGISLAAQEPPPGLSPRNHPRAGLPGFENLWGRIDADQTHGTLALDATHAALTLPGVFDDPRLRFDHLYGSGHWRIDAQPRPGDAYSAFHVTVPMLGLTNADAQVTLKADYTNPGHGRGALDLHAQIAHARLSQVPRYLPTSIGEALRHYLGHAFQAGTVRRARIDVHGGLDKFPYSLDPRAGQFRVLAPFDGARFDPSPYPPRALRDGAPNAWPALDGISGVFALAENRLRFDLARAHYRGFALTGVTGRIDDMGQRASNFVIAGRGQGPLADMLDYTNRSALADLSNHIGDTVRVRGPARLALTLTIPRTRAPKIGVAGALGLAGDGLARIDASGVDAGGIDAGGVDAGSANAAGTPAPSLLARLLSASNLVGTVYFTNRDAHFERLTGRFLGGDVSANGSLRDHRYALDVFGHLDADTARALDPQSQLPHSSLIDLPTRMSGRAPYTLAVRGASEAHDRRDPRAARAASEARRNVPDVALQSDLTGLALDLPAPFGKTASTPMPLRFTFQSGTGAEVRADVRADDAHAAARTAARAEASIAARAGNADPGRANLPPERSALRVLRDRPERPGLRDLPGLRYANLNLGPLAARYVLRAAPGEPLDVVRGTIRIGAVADDAADSVARNATNGAVSNATDSTTNDVANNTTNGANNNATSSATNGTVSNATDSATNDVANNTTNGTIDNATSSATNGTASNATDSATNDVANSTTNSTINNATSSATNGTVSNATDSATNNVANGAIDNAASRTASGANPRAGSPAPRANDVADIDATVDLDALNADAWRDVVLQARAASVANPPTAERATQTASASPLARYLPSHVAFRVGTLTLFGRRWENLVVNAARSDSARADRTDLADDRSGHGKGNDNDHDSLDGNAHSDDGSRHDGARDGNARIVNDDDGLDERTRGNDANRDANAPGNDRNDAHPRARSGSIGHHRDDDPPRPASAPSAWQADIASAQVTGHLSWQPGAAPDAPGALQARFARLAVPDASAGAAPNGAALAPVRSLPALDLVVDRLSVHGHDLGRLQANAHNVVDDGGARVWQLDRLDLRNPAAHLTASASWRVAAHRPRLSADATNHHQRAENASAASAQSSGESPANDAAETSQTRRRSANGERDANRADAMSAASNASAAGVANDEPSAGNANTSNGTIGETGTASETGTTRENAQPAENGKNTERAQPAENAQNTVAPENALPQRTTLDFHLDVTDAGALLERVGLPGTLEAGSGTLSGHASWRGSPLAIDYPTLDGTLALDMQRGQIPKIHPGAAKLLALFSLQDLAHVALFDFHDVRGQGLSFSRASGAARIRAGMGELHDVEVLTPPARVDVSGTVDLARQTQALRVHVRPRLNASAVVVAAAAVNPLFGLGALAADLALSQSIGAAFAVDYAVTGSWRAPRVERMHGAHGKMNTRMPVPAQ